MRCPKCKFISFDDLSNCAKCTHDLSAVAAELNGTCTETHLEFFLGPVIQTPNFDEEVFSDSQTLPPIEQSDINFDDTGSGEYESYKQSDGQSDGIDFDDSLGFAQQDDISIELGDIMPIDLDQLDVSSDLSEETTSDTLSLGSDDGTSAEESSSDNDIDFNLTGDFTNDNLDLDLSDNFADIDLDDTDIGVGDDTVLQSSSDVGDDTVLALDDEEVSSSDVSDNDLDLDSELISELSGSDDDLDATTTLTKSPEGFDTVNLSLTEESSDAEDFSNLDESLIEELSDIDVDDAGNSLSLSEEDTLLDLSEPSIEDLTGEFPPMPEDKEEPELNSLDFSDIDVSDLISPGESPFNTDTTDLTATLAESDTVRDAVSLGNDLTEHTELGAHIDENVVEFSENEELELGQFAESDLGSIESGDLDLTVDSNPQFDNTDNELPESELLLDEEGPPDLPT